MSDGKSVKTLDDVDLPMHADWDYDYEAPTRAYWRRTDVTNEELAADSKIHSAEDYAEGIDDYYRAYEMTIDGDGDGNWDVSVSTPSLQRGMGDLDPRYSMRGVSLAEALDHVRTVLEKKSS